MVLLKDLFFILSENDLLHKCDPKRYVIERFGLSLPEEDFYLTLNGKRVGQYDEPVANKTYRIQLRILGGKGGFGSMLRALGAQIEKTTNREACRDLSGRRMRDVNNEKKLREWTAKGKHIDKELEKAKRRKEKRERMKKLPHHTFEDEKYHEQKVKIADSIDDAMNHAFGKGKKRKAPSTTTNANPKIAKQWLGVDFNDDDDEDDDNKNGNNNNNNSNNNNNDDDNDDDNDKPDHPVAGCSGVSSKIGGDDDVGPSCSNNGVNVASTSKGGGDGDDVDDSTSSRSDDDDDNSTSDDSSDDDDEGDNMKSSKNGQNSNDDDDDKIVAMNDNSNDDKTNSKPISTTSANSSTQKVQQRQPTIEQSTENNNKTTTNSKSRSPPNSLEPNPIKTPAATGDTHSTATQEIKKSSTKPPTMPISKEVKVNLDDYTSAEQLAELGMDTLKQALMDRGLKCGGTLVERANRLFSVKGLMKDKYPKALLAKK